MKPITERECKTVRNALGQDTRCCYQDFEIESSDPREMRNYLGYGKAAQRVNVGDIITVMTDGTGWTCWSFKNRI